jgi:hypothetical protein
MLALCRLEDCTRELHRGGAREDPLDALLAVRPPQVDAIGKLVRRPGPGADARVGFVLAWQPPAIPAQAVNDLSGSTG